MEGLEEEAGEAHARNISGGAANQARSRESKRCVTKIGVGVLESGQSSMRNRSNKGSDGMAVALKALKGSRVSVAARKDGGWDEW